MKKLHIFLVCGVGSVGNRGLVWVFSMLGIYGAGCICRGKVGCDWFRSLEVFSALSSKVACFVAKDALYPVFALLPPMALVQTVEASSLCH